MTDERVTCIRCQEQIKYSNAMVDDKGQFPELSMKAMEKDQEETILCFECYEKLTEHDETIFENLDPARRYA